MEKAKTKTFLLAFVIGAAMPALIPPAVANEAVENVSKQIRDMRAHVTSAEIYLIPSNMESRYDYGENDVVRMGCRYVVDKTADLDSLLEVLVTAQFTQVMPSNHEYDARMVVRFRQGDSKLHTLVLGPDYDNANANGEYRVMANGLDHAISVEAKNKIERDLRFWASQHRSLAGKACGE